MAGVAVIGAFSGPTSETLTATTGPDGTASFDSAVVGRSRDPWCFAVDGVDAGSAVYDSALNVETTDCAKGGGATTNETRSETTRLLDVQRAE